LSAGFSALGGVLAGISWPVVAIAGLVAGVTAAGVAVVNFAGLGEPLMGVLSDVWTIAKNLTILGFDILKDALLDVAHLAGAVFVDAWNGATSVLASFLAVSEGQLVPAIKAIGQAVLESIPGLQQMIDAIGWLK